VELLDQAQVLPEGADAGPLPLPAAAWSGPGAAPCQSTAPAGGGNKAIGHRQQGALARPAGIRAGLTRSPPRGGPPQLQDNLLPGGWPRGPATGDGHRSSQQWRGSLGGGHRSADHLPISRNPTFCDGAYCVCDAGMKRFGTEEVRGSGPAGGCWH